MALDLEKRIGNNQRKLIRNKWFINASHNPNVDKIPHRIKLKVKLMTEDERNFLTELIEKNIRDISDQMIEIAD